ncbi:MAG TPA: flagellar protein FlhE [Terriglobia bacterium]|nr:flagellar protein FlhE [Terriglobia bacterium]
MRILRSLSVILVLALAATVAFANQTSDEVPIIPPTLYQEGYWYTTPVQANVYVPPAATIYHISWTLAYLPNNTLPSGIVVWLCDQSSNCTQLSTLFSTGSTDYFDGELADQTFKLYFEIPGSGSINPAYYGSNVSQVILDFQY